MLVMTLHNIHEYFIFRSRTMKLLTKEIEDKLRANYRANKKMYDNAHPDLPETYGNGVSSPYGFIDGDVRKTSECTDFPPVVKLFNPVGTGTWYLSELDDQDIAFGLCDLGHPEWGYVDLNELKSLKLPFGLGIERDIHWNGKICEA